MKRKRKPEHVLPCAKHDSTQLSVTAVNTLVGICSQKGINIPFEEAQEILQRLKEIFEQYHGVRARII